MPAEWLFCENETNVRRLFGMDGAGPVQGRHQRLRRRRRPRRGQPGACAAPNAPPICASTSRSGAQRRRPGCASARPSGDSDAFAYFDDRVAQRRADADEFYAALQADITDPDARLVQRQALAGMLWTKQFYLFDVRRWLDGDPAQPKPPPGRTAATTTGGT